MISPVIIGFGNRIELTIFDDSSENIAKIGIA